MPTIRPLVLLAVLLGATAAAMDSGVVRFVADRALAERGPVVLAGDGEKSGPVVLPASHLSEPVAAPARSFVVRPEKGDAAIAKVALPERGRSFVVLLLEAEGGCKPVTLASDDPAFKPSCIWFYNHADKPISGEVGTTAFKLAPGEARFVKPAGPLPEKLYEVALRVQEDDGERVLSRTRWPVEEQVRSYVVFYVDPATRRIKYRSVDEYIAAP